MADVSHVARLSGYPNETELDCCTVSYDGNDVFTKQLYVRVNISSMRLFLQESKLTLDTVDSETEACDERRPIDVSKTEWMAENIW